MKRTERRCISYANVTATLALVVALGGTSYAAVTITGKNIRNGSVGTADLGTGAVTSSKVRNHSLQQVDFKPGELSAGPRGAAGPAGPAGAAGPQGPAGPFAEALPSGKTLRGIYASQESVAGFHDRAISFAFALPSAPVGHAVPKAGPNPDPASCPGTDTEPQAAPGHLCVYESAQNGVQGPLLLGNVGRFGFTTSVYTPSGGYSVGTWAVTAP